MVRSIPLERILDNPFQTRTSYDKEHIAALAEDIRQHGLLQPPVVRLVLESGQPAPGAHFDRVMAAANPGEVMAEYNWFAQLAFGHCRTRALRHLLANDKPGKGRISLFSTMRVQFSVLSDEQMATLAWTENQQRKDLNPVEQAQAIERFIERFKWTQEQVAQRLQLARQTVTNKLRLLKLSNEALNLLATGEISERVASALIPLFDFLEEHPGFIDQHSSSLNDVSWFIEHAKSGSSDLVRTQVSHFLKVADRIIEEKKRQLRLDQVEPQAPTEDEGLGTCLYQYAGQTFTVPMLDGFIHKGREYCAVRSIVHVGDDGQPIEGHQFSVVDDTGAMVAPSWQTTDEAIEQARKRLAEQDVTQSDAPAPAQETGMYFIAHALDPEEGLPVVYGIGRSMAEARNDGNWNAPPGEDLTVTWSTKALYDAVAQQGGEVDFVIVDGVAMLKAEAPEVDEIPQAPPEVVHRGDGAAVHRTVGGGEAEPPAFPEPVYPDVWQHLPGYTVKQLCEVQQKYRCQPFYKYAQDFLASARKHEIFAHVQHLVQFHANMAAAYLLTDDQVDTLLEWMRENVKGHGYYFQAKDAAEAHAARVLSGLYDIEKLEMLEGEALTTFQRSHARLAGAFCYPEFLSSMRQRQQATEVRGELLTA